MRVLCEKRTVQYFKQGAKRNKENLEKDALVSKLSGSRGRRRSPTGWVNTINVEMGSVNVVVMMVQSCEEFGILHVSVVGILRVSTTRFTISNYP